MKLYPPGGGEPIEPHPTKIEEMKEKGWTEKPIKVKEEVKNGKS